MSMMGAGAPKANGLLGNVKHTAPRSTRTAGITTDYIRLLGSLRSNIVFKTTRISGATFVQHVGMYHPQTQPCTHVTPDCKAANSDRTCMSLPYMCGLIAREIIPQTLDTTTICKAAFQHSNIVAPATRALSCRLSFVEKASSCYHCSHASIRDQLGMATMAWPWCPYVLCLTSAECGVNLIA